MIQKNMNSASVKPERQEAKTASECKLRIGWMDPRSLKTVTDKFVSSTKKCVLLKNISESRSCGKAAARKFFFFYCLFFLKVYD